MDKLEMNLFLSLYNLIGNQISPLINLIWQIL